jgi:hypothetical protein
MLSENFKSLKFFTQREVEATGANIKDVQLGLMLGIDLFRGKIDALIHLLKNGMTTGDHKAEEHPKGEAIDFYFDIAMDIRKFIVTAILCGFRGIGIYINDKGQISFHLDLRPDLTIWKAKKNKKGIWKYETISFDPQGVKL